MARHLARTGKTQWNDMNYVEIAANARIFNSFNAGSQPLSRHRVLKDFGVQFA